MDVEIIRRLRLADPFRPFRVTLGDGRTFEVIKPQHLAMAQNNSRVLIVTGRETAVWFPPTAVTEAALISPTGAMTMSGGDR